MITISSEQKAHFQQLEDQRAILDIATYLTDVIPVDDPGYTEAETQETAQTSYHRGRALGLRLQRSLCLFAFLVRETGGAALTEPLIEEALCEPGGDPHHALDEIFRAMKITAQSEG